MAMASHTAHWTIRDLDELPDDGNKYEVVRGDLFVTPAPTRGHETIANRLTTLLLPYVTRNRLGAIFRPRAILRFDESQVEPDLMVQADDASFTWDNAPAPVLVVEIVSPSTRWRDVGPKRDLYMDAGVDEYWIVDSEARTIRSIRRDRNDIVARDQIVWTAPSVSESLVIDVEEVFGRR